MPPTFKKATDLLCLSAPELERIFKVPAQSIRQARLEPENQGYRPPPSGWEPVLAKMARERARALNQLAADMEGATPTDEQRYHRLHLSRDDLREALESCQRLLELDQFDRPTLDREAADFQAHRTRLIVSYARPFTRHHSPDLAERRLPKTVLASFDDDEVVLHRRMLSARHEEFAHSDAAAADLSLDVDHSKAVPVLVGRRAMRLDPSREDAERLQGMIGKLIEAVRALQRELEPQLEQGRRG